MLLVALALVACDAAPASLPTRPFASPSRRWSGDDAVGALRNRLRARGYAPDVSGGPMVALWDELGPGDPMAGEPAVPAVVRRHGPGAWLVMTDGGSWWVWQTTDRGPLVDPPTLTF